MNKIHFFRWISILFLSLLFGQSLDSRYHTLDEIYDYLYEIEDDPATDYFYRIDTVGYSTQENSPCYPSRF